jgi:hypothetical protein
MIAAVNDVHVASGFVDGEPSRFVQLQSAAKPELARAFSRTAKREREDVASLA